MVAAGQPAVNRGSPKPAWGWKACTSPDPFKYSTHHSDTASLLVLISRVSMVR